MGILLYKLKTWKHSYAIAQTMKFIRKLAKSLPECNLASNSVSTFLESTYNWNRKLRSHVELNNPRKALAEYAHMRRNSCKVDSYTLLFVIKACNLVFLKDSGINRQIHTHVIKLGFDSEVITQTAVLKMYADYEDLESAQKVFDETPHRDLVQWNTLIAAYSRRGYPDQAIIIGKDMFDGNLRPNEVTLSSIISAFSQTNCLSEGRSAHAYAVRNFVKIDTVIFNSLIDMYAKCGFFHYSRKLFATMKNRNVISWTTIINAHYNNNYLYEVLDLFKKMEAEGIAPDEVIILSLILTCARLGSPDLGDWIDSYIEKTSRCSIILTNALIDMHARCGNIKKSCAIFNQTVERTLVTWTVMIQGLAMHGQGVAALIRFSQMLREGFKPDDIVFLNVISACNHSRLVKEGMNCFNSMVKDHNIKPNMEHYGSMVDLLCRGGFVREAFGLVISMPMKPDGVILRTVIGACKEPGDFHLARFMISQLIDQEPQQSGNYILKSNLHAMFGEWSCVEEVRDDMRKRTVSKPKPGSSLLEANTL